MNKAAEKIPDLKLIVGLGNIGAQYENTRHNVGVEVLDLLAQRYGIALRPESKFMGYLGRGNIEETTQLLLFPTTYMNESGRAVAAVCNFYKIKPEQILVIHDDLDLNPGSMRLKYGGGLAGHNGLKSIVSCLANSADFYRLRIGIGKAPSGQTINWVLGRASGHDADFIQQAMDEAVNSFKTLFTKGLDRATSQVNGFKITE